MVTCISKNQQRGKIKTIDYKLNTMFIILPLCVGQLIREDNQFLNVTYVYEYGHWVSPHNYGSDARNLLSLPNCNTMTNTSSCILSKETNVLSGKAAPLFGHSGGG